MRRLPALVTALAAALTLASTAVAAVEVRGVDAEGYPSIRLTLVTSEPTAVAPRLQENGSNVAGLQAKNLGRAKSIVLALDRSKSMEGQPFVDAVAAARAFVAGKAADDRISIVAFGSDAVALTGFSSATIDADGALRSLSVDDRQGTALYDALAIAGRSLTSEPLPGRVIIFLTDGADLGSKESLAAAVAAARTSGAAVYPIAIESRQFSREPLEQIARETGGAYYGAAETHALSEIYASIAEELARTWQVEYVTAARPGEHLTLRASGPGIGAATAELDVPGVSPKVDAPEPSSLLPTKVLESTWGATVLGIAVALLVLLAGAFAFAAPKGAWLRNRLSPHVGTKRPEAKKKLDRERLALASGLFRATERTLGHLKPWKKLASMIDRADLPLRTVEFVYLMAGSGLFVGTIAAVAGPPTPVVLVALVGGALLPYGFVWFKARRRLKAFENQLPDLLITMAASLKAGHSFRQGMQAVVEEGQEPASKEFKRVLTETRLGRPMDAALSEMAHRVGSKNLEFVITAVTIQRQVGGSLAGIFDMVAETVRNRQQFQRKIKGLTAMGRASAYVLIGLPFFVLGAITLINAEYMSPLYFSSTGQKLIIIMLVMMGLGSLMLKKIVSFKG